MVESSGKDNDESNGGEERVDELPRDLQPALADRSAYEFPNNHRRRIPGYLYVGASVIVLALIIYNAQSIYVNAGLVIGATGLGAFGVYAIRAGVDLEVDEEQALVAATKACGFPVGHGSAQMVWYGADSRPQWRVLMYSTDEPPSKRGFALIDGCHGSVIASLSEDNPERWETK